MRHNLLFLLLLIIIGYVKVGAVEGRVHVAGMVVDVVKVVPEGVEPNDGGDRWCNGWDVAQHGRKLPTRYNLFVHVITEVDIFSTPVRFLDLSDKVMGLFKSNSNFLESTKARNFDSSQDMIHLSLLRSSNLEQIQLKLGPMISQLNK